jgi:hypothetical protein
VVIGASRVGPVLGVVLASLSVEASWAAEAELRLVAPELAVGQTSGVRVVVRGQRPTAPPRLTVSPDEGLAIAYEQQSNQVTIVNGRVNESTEFLYRVTAREPGRYTLGPGRVEIGTREVLTNAVDLVVRPAADGQPEGVTAYAGFLVEKAYVGQVVVFRRGLRSPLPIDRDAWAALPLDGLLSPRDGAPAYAEYVLRGDDGQTFVKEEFHPKIARAVGEREVPATAARVAVRIPGAGRGPFSIGRTRTEVVAVPGSALRVEPLPPAPPDFSGLVGRFTFTAELDRTDAAVGDSVNLVVRAVGDGALEGFELPPTPSGAAYRTYDGSPATSARVDASGFAAEGVFSRVVVPTRRGEIELPPLRIVTFDPVDGRYVTHTVPLPPLRVAAGRDDDGAGSASFVTPDADTGLVVEPAFEGVREPRRSGWVHLAWIGPVMPFTLGLAALPLLVLGAADGLRWLRAGLARLPARSAPRPLTPAQRLARLPSDGAERLRVLDGALRAAVAEAVGEPVGTLDRDRAVDGLGDRADEVRALFRALDRARFGDGAAPPDLPARVGAAVRALAPAKGRR